MISGAASSTAGTATTAVDPVKAKQLEQLKGAARQFEAVFLRQMIGSMRAAKLGDDILGSDASNQFRDMSDARLADSMAGRGTLGIAEMLTKQFAARLGTATGPAMKAVSQVTTSANTAAAASAADSAAEIGKSK